MKKLLYIKVNSKPESQSASLQVGRQVVLEIQSKYPEFQLEELDLYKVKIPRLEAQYFASRNGLVKGTELAQLSSNKQEEVKQIVALCDQFIAADVVVIAAPMWSLSFPAPLKEYIDCIVQNERTIKIEEGKMPKGLLDDKLRTVIYVQSSGGNIPWLLNPIYNKGVSYVKDIMKFMGIKKFEELLVDGTGYTEVEKAEAIKEALEKVDEVVNHVVFQQEN